MPSTLDRLSYEAGQLLKFLGALASANGGPAAMLRSLGWDLPPGGQDLGFAAIDLSNLAQKLDALDQASSSGASDAVLAAKFAEVFLELQRAIAHVRATIAGLSAAGDYLDKTQIKSEILGRLSSLLIASRVGSISPLAFVLLQFFGVITMRHLGADPGIYQVDHVRVTFDWDALTKLFTDPLALLKSRYGWGTAAFDARGFIVNLNAIVEVLGEPSRVRQLPRRVEEQLTGASMPEADTNPATQVIGNFISGDRSGGFEAGISMFPLRPTAPNGVDGGIAVCPFVYGATDLKFPLSAELTLEFQSTVALDSGVALQFRPGRNMSIKAGLLTGAVEDHVSGTALVSLTWAAPDGNKFSLVSLPGGGIIEAGSIAFAGGVDVLEGSVSPSFALKLTGGHAMLRADGADSFVSSLVPAGGVEAHFDVGLRWSAAKGFRFEGSASAAIDIPLNAAIGGLKIESLHIEVLPSNAGLAVESSVTCDATIGPIGVSLERFGVVVEIAVRDGNLGPVDVSLDFKPPSGAGLVVDAAGVSGGGFLAHDEARHEYSGVLQLQFTDFSLQAFGLITTQVAGKAGYSLIALVDADFPPVQLGWGFTLNGVGGLLAINRGASVDALRAALKANQLSSILFPKNAITNAPQILAQLDSLFPTAHGRFLFGPMALIGWGTPTVLTAAIAVIVELPEPIRIILLARVALRAPSQSNALVRINMDALGVLDLNKGELSLDAVLFDSKLISFTLSGSMALRAAWAGQREFLLAVGGFHPRFTPPPGFPALQRITIDMPSGAVSKLRLAAYFAITSNTVQFGAKLDVFVGVSGFGLSGHLGFDALLQLSPFHFEADISGKVSLQAGGDDLMSVSLDGQLSGPAPWHISGSFKIHIVFFDVHKSFSHSWGEDAPAIAATTVDVAQLLKATFADPRSWDAQMPDGVASLTPLRQIQDTASVLAHPLALPEVHERIVPLGLTITRFGEAAPAGGSRFDITDWRLGGAAPPRTAIDDDFAPAQFFDLGDEEKLARPSFERHTAGMQMTAGLVASGPAATKTILYETFFIDDPGGAPRSDPGVPVTPPVFGDLVAILEIGSAGRSSISRASYRKYGAPGNPVRVAEPRFAVVDGGSLSPAGGGPSGGSTYSEAAALLAAAISHAPERRGDLGIVATHEMGVA